MLVIYSLIGCQIDTSSEFIPLYNTVNLPDSNKIIYGRKVYLKTCIKCHRPMNLRQYSDDQWRAIIKKKLSDDPLLMTDKEKESILYFLTYGNSSGGGLVGGSIVLEPELEQ